MKRLKGSFGVSLAATGATVLLHSLFFAIAIWGGGAPSRFPDEPDAIGAGANQGKPDGDVTERRMVVRLLSATPSSEPAPTETLLMEALRVPAKLDITGPDALPLPPLVVSDNGSPADGTDADLIARAKMVGVYQSQIRARIERAWEVPEEQVDEPDFSCQALIRQQRDGRVLEVELPYEKCNGSSKLRQSVVNAIFGASPLPAPPHPGVFIDSFSLVLRPRTMPDR